VDKALQQRRDVFGDQNSDLSRIVEGYVQEARLSRWAVDFNLEIILPMQKLLQDSNIPAKFFVKYFELRPYNYAMI
jgi:hypothetical protein